MPGARAATQAPGIWLSELGSERGWERLAARATPLGRRGQRDRLCTGTAMASRLRQCQYVGNQAEPRSPGSGRKGLEAMTYINNFDDVGRGDVAIAGGKGVGLGGLSQGGLPVPPWFVLNTAAYADYVDANHLEAGIHELTALSPHAEPRDYE